MIRSRKEIPCPTCGAPVGVSCRGVAPNRAHTARALRVSRRPCGCVVYRHDLTVRTPCHGQHGASLRGEVHPDAKWNPATKCFVFPPEEV